MVSALKVKILNYKVLLWSAFNCADESVYFLTDINHKYKFKMFFWETFSQNLFFDLFSNLRDFLFTCLKGYNCLILNKQFFICHFIYIYISFYILQLSKHKRFY